MLRFFFLVLISSSLAGCYYLQAAKGQLELTRKREPIAEILQDEDTSPELAARLRLVQEARQFSIDTLALPDNESYRSYADIERDFVVWSVVAAPEFSMEARTWCFPVAGCVSYRGYFSEQSARREAERLEADGYDVFVGGVAAYSTLGKLRDPVVSSMMNWDDVQLVAVLFHELAHQVLYVKGDSGFNESFATAVEEFGVHRWLEARGQAADIERYESRRQLRQTLMEVTATARADLESLYASDLPNDEKRGRKQTRLDALAEEMAQLAGNAGHGAGSWKNGELNNARLATMTLYEGRLPEFRALFAQCDQRIDCFYDKARALAATLD
ncbi:MAG: aminopeptidase [Gammaproteobacteria bacterium]|nr:aminopeptidase [Gammaproteobacteria bacterium]